MKKFFALLICSFASLVFAQDDFASLRQRTEQEVCAEIKNHTAAPDGSCTIVEWTNLNYQVNFSLSGSRSTSKTNSRPSLGGLGGGIQTKSWTRTTWNYAFAGKTNCTLNGETYQWSCSSTIEPFTATGLSEDCSCQVTGFAGCGPTTRCGGFQRPASINGLNLIGPDPLSSVVTTYSETHLFR